jgi:large subunit ribosomal protein L4
MRSILSELARQNRLVAVDAFTVEQPKTRMLVEKLAHFGTDDVLIVTDALDRNLGLSARNLHKIDVRDVAGMDPLALVGHEKVIVTVPALKRIQEMLA